MGKFFTNLTNEWSNKFSRRSQNRSSILT